LAAVNKNPQYRPVIKASASLKAKMRRLSQQPPVSYVTARDQAQTVHRLMLAGSRNKSR
jgi:hypothetical protein